MCIHYLIHDIVQGAYCSATIDGGCQRYQIGRACRGSACTCGPSFWCRGNFVAHKGIPPYILVVLTMYQATKMICWSACWHYWKLLMMCNVNVKYVEFNLVLPCLLLVSACLSGLHGNLKLHIVFIAISTGSTGSKSRGVQCDCGDLCSLPCICCWRHTRWCHRV